MGLSLKEQLKPLADRYRSHPVVQRQIAQITANLEGESTTISCKKARDEVLIWAENRIGSLPAAARSHHEFEHTPPGRFAAALRVKHHQEDMLRWLYVANAKAHYSGSSESKLDYDIGLLFRGNSFEALIEPLHQRYGRLHVEAGDFAGRDPRNALFSLAYLALKHSGAKDWRTGLGLSLTHQGKLHYIEYHHIFPKSLLQKAGYEKAEINEIANMAFISGRANRGISNKEPKDYFPGIVKERSENALSSQYIPLDTAMWEIAAYRDFLGYRRQALAKAVNEFIESACKAGRATALASKAA